MNSKAPDMAKLERRFQKTLAAFDDLQIDDARAARAASAHRKARAELAGAKLQNAADLLTLGRTAAIALRREFPSSRHDGDAVALALRALEKLNIALEDSIKIRRARNESKSEI